MKLLLENWRKYLKEEETPKKRKLYFLVGPPAVGKSTWIKQNAGTNSVVINRDELVEKVAKESGVGTYDDMYVRPMKKFVPPGMPTKEMMQDPQQSAKVDEYVKKVAASAQRFNASEDPKLRRRIKRYGRLIPFDKNAFETVIVRFGVDPSRIIPFEYSSLKRANDNVNKLLDTNRREAAGTQKDIIIDMTNMSINERNIHRQFFVAALENVNQKEANPQNINQYFDQIAIVFGPQGGYPTELQQKIKDVAGFRAKQIKRAGGSKTIPEDAYDRMFAQYKEPTSEEGFVDIQFVGVPSLKAMKDAALFRKAKGKRVHRGNIREALEEAVDKIRFLLKEMDVEAIKKEREEKLENQKYDFYSDLEERYSENCGVIYGLAPFGDKIKAMSLEQYKEFVHNEMLENCERYKKDIQNQDMANADAHGYATGEY